MCDIAFAFDTRGARRGTKQRSPRSEELQIAGAGRAPELATATDDMTAIAVHDMRNGHSVSHEADFHVRRRAGARHDVCDLMKLPMPRRMALRVSRDVCASRPLSLAPRGSTFCPFVYSHALAQNISPGAQLHRMW